MWVCGLDNGRFFGGEVEWGEEDTVEEEEDLVDSGGEGFEEGEVLLLLEHLCDGYADDEVGVCGEGGVEEVGCHCEEEFVAGVEMVEGSANWDIVSGMCRYRIESQG